MLFKILCQIVICSILFDLCSILLSSIFPYPLFKAQQVIFAIVILAFLSYAVIETTCSEAQQAY